MQSELTDEHRLFLSINLASQAEFRFARAAVLFSAMFFFAAVPFAKTPLGEMPGFMPIYVSAFLICDLVTAVLLFGQFRVLRSRALLVLASGYLFTAFFAVAYALTLKGLFAPTGLLGAGLQTTAWMYMFWHYGFPLVVIAYALLKDEGGEAIVTSGRPRTNARFAILSSVVTVSSIVC